jgi:hypothetical protein
MTDPNLQAILDKMRQDREEARQAREETRQAQQQNVQLLTELVACLVIPPHNSYDNQNQDNYDNRNRDNKNRHRNNPPIRDRNRDGGLRAEIPDFSGSLKPEEFLDWMNIIEEVFDLKEISLEKRVPLVTIQF